MNTSDKTIAELMRDRARHSLAIAAIQSLDAEEHEKHAEKVITFAARYEAESALPGGSTDAVFEEFMRESDAHLARCAAHNAMLSAEVARLKTDLPKP